MNLTICLLMARRFVSKEQLRSVVEGYHDLSDAAFNRTFERDKNELRDLGIPLETGSNSALFAEEVGYRIRREAFELPEISFTPAEAAALVLAATVWESSSHARHTQTALAKLRAIGLEPDPERLRGLDATISTREPGFETVWEATRSRTPIRFRYRGQERIVEGWTMGNRHGSWYLVGWDQGKDAQRMFKLARMEDLPALVGRPGSYQVPDQDFSQAWENLRPDLVEEQAVVAIRAGRATALRRGGEPLADHPKLPGYQVYRVTPTGPNAVARLCAYGSDVLVLEPSELQAEVIAWLTRISEGQ